MAAATGSPASRRSTNRTPLTTRPSLTSRQGMTRTLNTRSSRARRADQLQGRSSIESPVVERASYDRAGELLRARREQRLDVRERGEAARSNHGNRSRLRQRERGLEIEPGQQSVARNVGMDDGGDARILEALGKIERAKLRCLRPPFDRNHAIARIKADGNAAGKL